jgi:phospholipid/cholesterol/gamma-HCH transport system substrate-binding protein
MTRQRPLPLVLLVVMALFAAACAGPAGRDAIQLTATFDDVADLVTNHEVRAGDVPIGVITAIELDEDNRALVTMSIRSDTGLPADIEAALNRTSLLGERYIDLRPRGEGGALEDGMHIGDTRMVTDFEDLVASGDRVLSLVASDQLNAAIETGAIAFGGRGGLLGQFLGDLEGFVSSYNEGSDDLVRLIDALDGLATTLAPDAEVNAEGLAVLERASRVLEEEDDRLLDALSDLSDLADNGAQLLEDHRTEIEDSIRTLRVVLSQITRIDGAMADVLTWLPRHNIHVPNGVALEQGSGRHVAQVWLDFIICGINDVPGDPARACDPPNPGQPSPHPDEFPRSEECYDDLEACREETDRENRGEAAPEERR